MEITVTVTTPGGKVIGQTLTIDKADLPHYREAQHFGLFDSVIEHRLPARRRVSGTLAQHGAREVKVEHGCLMR
jgi:hypothetical protein